MRPISIAGSAMRTVLLILIVFSFTNAFASDSKAELETLDITNEHPASILVKKAKSLQKTEPKASAKLAKLALQKAQEANNQSVVAQAHIVLAKLAKKSKDTEQAKRHFTQAIIAYQEIGERQKQIRTNIDLIKIIYDEKSYNEGIQSADKLLEVAKQHGEETTIGLVMLTKGDGLYKQKKYESAINSYSNAINHLVKNDSDTQRLLALSHHQIGQSFKRLKNHEQSISHFKKSLELYTILQDDSSIAKSLKNIATAEYQKRNYIVSLDYFIRALDLQEKLENESELAEISNWIGMIYRKIRLFEKSLEYIYKSHLIYKKNGNIDKTADTSNQIGLIYTRLNQFDQARSFFQLSIELPADKVKPKTLAAAYRELAVIEYESGNYENAMELILKARSFYLQLDDNLRLSHVARTIGKIYKAQDKLQSAQSYLQKSLTLAQKANSTDYQISSLKLLGSLLIGKDTEHAIQLLNQALELAEETNNNKAKLSLFKSLKKAYISKDNLELALQYADKTFEISEVINKEKEKTELARAKAILESHKMEMEIDRLREKVKVDSLKIAQKNNEIEIVRQANQISELELSKNRYANILLAILLLVCLIAVFYIFRIFTASKNRNKELDYLAARDPLTNCFNRRALSERMSRDFEELQLIGNYSVILADIDFFKEVNDTHGHIFGDSVLKGVAQIIQKSIRQNDIAARFGGEEFCITLPGADANHAIQIAEKMRELIESTSFNEVRITCSFGVSSIASNAKNPSELIDQADFALYKSKSRGRNQTTLWQSSLKGKG